MQFKQVGKQQQNQQLNMTQNLSQAISMLEFNSEEVLAFVEDKALGNPLIEVVRPSSDFKESLEAGRRLGGAGAGAEEFDRFSQLPEKQQSLLEYLVEQIYMNYRDTPIRQKILYLVEFIDSNGYLSIDLDEAVASNGGAFMEYLDALTLLQQLEPAGVGARNLQECLMLQTERDQHAPAIAYLILEEDFQLFADRKWAEIAKDYQVELKDIQAVSDYVVKLSPNPGADFGGSMAQVSYPDIRVLFEEGEINVYSTKFGAPELIFQESYLQEMSQYQDQEVETYLTDKQQEFEWLQNSLSYRNETILKVGLQIVERQKEFFKETTRVLKPLTLKEVAEAIGVHESTVSRAVNGKYLETAFGVFELKHFFSTKLASSDEGVDQSADQAQQAIQDIIEKETKTKPLSDQKIVTLLEEQGIAVSRRTVAKYRDVLGIPSSSQRKRFE
ncbi:RNA polymerase factor sigma-54 [Vagococcus coleopterorum]|uniref:RNA polymerase factor sigma-54 n=1 Tax=Vagococcus coleopterorum TaxID=2714946 RepID=A0A6G8AKV6_9ENTE|nr:RNA polymerase factor sigma-54 [Vagococcus coleopterorum]QIL45610.1 RNA polymerase factor sigma-54 [Vagococcus coleopterorum]